MALAKQLVRERFAAAVPARIPVVVENNNGYDTKRTLYFLTLPLMLVFAGWVFLKKKIIGRNPETNILWFDGLSRSCRMVKEGAASWRALDIIYNFTFTGRGIEGIVENYWFGMMNAQAVRNRFKLVKRELMWAIIEIAKTEKEIRLLSLASGSAQPIIEAINELREFNIKATLVDLDPSAIDYSRQLAKRYGVEDRITFVVGSLSALGRITNGRRPHIIEMVGFLDYRPTAKATHLIKKIHDVLLPGGIFLTANICPNPEQYFLKWVINWSMIYRRSEELGEILVNAGFSPKNCQIFCEPLKFYAIAICRKFV